MIKPDAKESRVKDVCKKLLKEFGAYYFMPAMNAYGRSGVPDIVGCYKGRFFSIECKAPSRANNVSELQKLEMEKIRVSGGMAFVATNDMTVELVKLWLEGA